MEPLAYTVLAVVAAAVSLIVAPELIGFGVLGLGLLLVYAGSAWAAAAVIFTGLGLLEIVAGEEARDAATSRRRRAWATTSRGLGAVEAALAAGAVATIAHVV